MKMLNDKWDGYAVVPHNCACCRTCWLYVEGPWKGICVYRGPYRGYVTIPEPEITLDPPVEN